LEKLGTNYIQAYLTYQSAKYANYQPEHLASTNFSQVKYLATIDKELELVRQRIKAYQRKEN
jgi:hypothetical protein